MNQYNAFDIYDILNSSAIKRWTTVDTSRQQSLAEHTFNVIAIARAIAKALRISDKNITKYAFDHDLDELISGDLPTPAKEYLGIKSYYGGVSKSRCSEDDIMVVGIADKIEAAWFCTHFVIGPKGNAVEKNVFDRLNDALAALPKEIEEVIVKEVIHKIRGIQNIKGKGRELQ